MDCCSTNLFVGIRRFETTRGMTDLSKRAREGSKTDPSFFISKPLRVGDRHQTERVFRRTTSRSARMSSSGSSMSSCSLPVPPH
jgi:hypothetical protein